MKRPLNPTWQIDWLDTKGMICINGNRYWQAKAAMTVESLYTEKPRCVWEGWVFLYCVSVQTHKRSLEKHLLILITVSLPIERKTATSQEQINAITPAENLWSIKLFTSMNCRNWYELWQHSAARQTYVYQLGAFNQMLNAFMVKWKEIIAVVRNADLWQPFFRVS